MNHETSRSVETADAYRTLQFHLNHDQELNQLTRDTRPMSVHELQPTIATSKEFRDVVTAYGWPERHVDTMKPAAVFMNDDEFREAFTEGIEINGEDVYLNNFKEWIRQKPNQDSGFNLDKLYGSLPAVQRGMVIAPEFLNALRTAYCSLPKRPIQVHPDVETLSSPEAELVVSAAHLAYRLYGRLIKHDDDSTHMKKMLGGSEHMTTIDDAGKYLAR